MTTAILLAVLVLACIYGGYAYVKKLRAGGGCCGPHEAAEKKVRVADRDKSHYPYTAVLRVDGMTCSNCVRRVENALNRLDGVWAEADLGQETARMRMKRPLEDRVLADAVRDARYRVREIKREEPDEGLESDRDRKE